MRVLIGLCILAVALARQEKCPEHQTYHGCGTACPLTCDNYENPPKICGLVCNPGCHCDDGYVKTKDERCVKPEECPVKNKPDNVVDKSCLAKKDPGWCKAFFLSWYYNTQTGTCQKFVYGGCQGNSNRFDTEKECLRRCKGVKYDICAQPAESGTCLANFQRFYFDKISGHCRMFIYGGCNGNGNNFRSPQECERRCRKSG